MSTVSRQELETRNLKPETRLVGREEELAQLQSWLDKARQGERQMAFVTGEPGIGKTALVETFLARLAAAGDLWVAQGQCVEHYGAGEAYLPVLAALERLAQALGSERLSGVLRQHAPLWLVQLPSLTDPAERESLQRQLVGTTRQRMLREIAQALEALTTERVLVLWLEDLHGSDYSTLDLLAYLAQRPKRARVLVIGTYRPVEVLAREHPLGAVQQELLLHGQCQELPLGALTEAAVGEYLAVRFSSGTLGTALPPELLSGVGFLLGTAHGRHSRESGNPAIPRVTAQRAWMPACAGMTAERA